MVIKRYFFLSAILLFCSAAGFEHSVRTAFDFYLYFYGELRTGYNGGLSFQLTDTK